MGIRGDSVLVPWRPLKTIAAEVVPPLGAASCGLGCVYTPTAPCTPLPPVWEVGRARHRVSPPHARSWPSSPPSHWHPRHARARGLAAAARLGRPDPGSPRSVPPPNTPPPIPFPLECKGPPRPLASSPLLLSSPRPLHKRRRLVLLHAPSTPSPSRSTFAPTPPVMPVVPLCRPLVVTPTTPTPFPSTGRMRWNSVSASFMPNIEAPARE